MRVRAISSFCIGGGRDVERGEEFDAEDYNARRWIYMGFVVAVEAAPAAASMPARQAITAADEVQVREPEPEHREPRPPRRKGE